MSFGSVDDWLDFMPETVVVYPLVSYSVSGQPTYSSTGTSYAARIEMGNRIVKDDKGKEVVSSGLIILGTSSLIGIKDKLMLPSNFVPNSPPIITVNPVGDEDGVHHLEVYVG